MKIAIASLAFVLSFVFAGSLQAQEWTKPKLQKMYMNFLKEEGFRPELDEDGDIVFKREGATFLIIISEKDPNFFMLALANIWKIESEEELVKAIVSANQANDKSKVAKTYITETQKVWVSVEAFLDEPTDFKKVFDRSLRAIDNAVAVFVEKMREE